MLLHGAAPAESLRATLKDDALCAKLVEQASAALAALAGSHEALRWQAEVRAEARNRHTRSDDVWAAKRAVVNAGRAVVAAERVVAVVPASARAPRRTREVAVSPRPPTPPPPQAEAQELVGTVARLEAAAQEAERKARQARDDKKTETDFAKIDADLAEQAAMLRTIRKLRERKNRA